MGTSYVSAFRFLEIDRIFFLWGRANHGRQIALALDCVGELWGDTNKGARFRDIR